MALSLELWLFSVPFRPPFCYHGLAINETKATTIKKEKISILCFSKRNEKVTVKKEKVNAREREKKNKREIFFCIKMGLN